jgi:predicted ester cyclase
MNPLLIPVSVLAILLLAGCEADVDPMNKQLTAKCLEKMLMRRQFDSWSECFGTGYSYNGTTLARRAYEATADGLHLAFPDIAMQIVDQVEEGDKVVTQVRFSGTHTGRFSNMVNSGVEVEFTGVMIDRVSDGRIMDSRHSIDLWHVAQQLSSASNRGGQ